MNTLKRRARAVGIDHWPGGITTDPVRAELVSWAEERGVRQSRAPRVCLHWLATGRCTDAGCAEQWARYRCLDHSLGWTREGKPAYITAAPYELNTDSMHAILEGCRRFGLGIYVDGRGWYGHGTVHVELTPEPSAHELKPGRIKTPSS